MQNSELQFNKGEKVVLLDFCETIVKFQTADNFVFFVGKKNPSLRYKLLEIFYKVMIKLKIEMIISRFFPSISFNKRLILIRLSNYMINDLESYAKEYYLDVLKPNFILASIKFLKTLQAEKYRVIILSGGYDLYLRYFAEEYNINDIISTKIGFKKNRCTGKFNGDDCLWKNKVRLLEEYCIKRKIKIDRDNSFAITDSESDLPMLNYVGKQVIVHRSDKNEWYKKFKFENIILWEN